MDWFLQLVRNAIIINGSIAWVSAQVLKTLIHAVVNKKLDLPRLVGDGGMPSSHSATVTAVAATCALNYGLSSYQFGISAMLAFIVMHDAMGVRLEAGKQAKVLNQMIAFIDSFGQDLTPEEKLKEFVGHTPMQVFAGAALGLMIALVF
ncbi:divergent PAP2 family protein [Oscillospiraceae bacterium CM]|nr:divergent PAP2 family protein [Oscillospiraceae bacterium CM]